MSTNNAAIVETLLDLLAEKVAERLRGTSVKSDTKLLDVKTCASYLGRPISTVRHMAANGQIPKSCIRKFSNRTFFVKQELDKWMDAQ